MPETKILTAAGAFARLLRSTQQQTEKVAKSCPADRHLFQLGPNKATPLWLLGHLTNTAEFIGNTVALGLPSGAMPDAWRKRFTPEMFGGSPITTNPADYPTMEEVIAAYSKVMAHLADNAAGLSDDDLLGNPKGKFPDALKALVQTTQDCLTLNVVHDSHHRGQFALLANAPR